MDPVIQLSGVTKNYGSETALKTVRLEVPPGVVFALLGENGAGKTTAIRIMLGLTEPNSGRAKVLGMNSETDGLLIRRRTGYVPEQATLYEWMTVGEIGWFTAGFYGDGFWEQYLRLAKEFGLPVRRKLRALSKGMRAKVSLALAIAHDPELLILDEPTSGLDALVRREFLESMVDRAAAGRTVFLSSHQIGEVERVADVVAILRDGELLLVERLDELKAQIREVTLTLTDDAPRLPSVPGEILNQRAKARQWRLLVRGLEEDQMGGLRQDPSVRQIEVRAPNLEEIFVAYMRLGKSSEAGCFREEAPLQ